MSEPVLPSPRLPKEQLLTLFREIAGVQVVWNTGRRGLLGNRPGDERAWILIGLMAWREIGTDELRYSWNEATGQNDELLVGQRSFTVPVQAFSIDPTLEAFDLCERIRFHMRTETARKLMVPTLALRDFQNIVQPPPEQLTVNGIGHIVLRATLDVRMLAVIGAALNDPGGTNVIESAPVPPGVIGENLIP
jgi:hypothetical protein